VQVTPEASHVFSYSIGHSYLLLSLKVKFEVDLLYSYSLPPLTTSNGILIKCAKISLYNFI